MLYGMHKYTVFSAFNAAGLAQTPGTVESAQAVVTGDLNQALVSLGLVLLMSVVFINRFLDCFVVTWLLIYLFCEWQPSHWLARPFFAPIQWLAGQIVSEQTYSVSTETLNPTRLYYFKTVVCSRLLILQWKFVLFWICRYISCWDVMAGWLPGCFRCILTIYSSSLIGACWTDGKVCSRECSVFALQATKSAQQSAACT